MKVTITAQDHPLYSQQFNLCGVSASDKGLEVTLNLPDGEQLTIRSNLTDYFMISDDSTSRTLHLLDIEGLCEIAEFVDQAKMEEVE